MHYKSYSSNNFTKIPQIESLSAGQIREIEIVSSVLPFKTNNYVTDRLINWDNIPNDPIFILTFPQKEMLKPRHYELAEKAYHTKDLKEKSAIIKQIRMELNPHPAGQTDLNVPKSGEEKLQGTQHKYRQTVLFFPSQGQTCHAYCTFCFRWPQFTGISELKFSSNEVDKLIKYLEENPQITDVLFTGGDPMVMRAHILRKYIEPLLQSNLTSLKNIRIGTKALGYWPQRFYSDSDAPELLKLFKQVKKSGKHLAIMAHFNHNVELETEEVSQAVKKILKTGAVIRTQSPIMEHINNDSGVWSKMWSKQVELGMIPYYMFIARNTGAQHYFSVPLSIAFQKYREAYQSVSGICRTVRGPSMSCLPGKVQVLGINEIAGEKVFTLRFIQGRNPDWIGRPFFAKFDPKAIWYTDLVPAFGEAKFFFTDELNRMVSGGDEEDDFE